MTPRADSSGLPDSPAVRGPFLSDVDDEGPEFSLREAAAFGDADFLAAAVPGVSVASLSGGRARIVTAPEAWAYAAHLRLDPTALPEGVYLLVRADLWVESGALNLVLVDGAGEAMMSATRAAPDGRTAISFWLKPDERPAEIVIRNDVGGVSSGVVERVQIYALESAPLPADTGAQARLPTAASAPIAKGFGKARRRRAWFGPRPLVSLILTVRNGLPYLRDALESVRAQTYGNIELVVQDCLSTDGSSELLQQFDGAPIHIRRESDRGIGDANNRAMARCKGAVIGSIDSDNLLEPDAVARAVAFFKAHPSHAVVYGAVCMIDEAGGPLHTFRPGPFDVLELVSCDLVPPWSTSFFNRAVCGSELRLDPARRTCADFDVWLRLSHLPIAYLDTPFGSTRLSSASMSRRPEIYERFCQDKIEALDKYVRKCAHEPLRHALLRQGRVGVYCWAAEGVRELAPDQPQLAQAYFEKAREIDPDSARVALCAQRIFTA